MNYNPAIIHNYFDMISLLNRNYQSELVNLIAQSLAKKKVRQEKSISHLFGVWESLETAEEMVENFRKSRVFNRNIELF